MPIQSCGQSVSAPRGQAGVMLNAHTELRAERQRSAREAICSAYSAHLVISSAAWMPAVFLTLKTVLTILVAPKLAY